jgi:hypothetical protein
LLTPRAGFGPGDGFCASLFVLRTCPQKIHWPGLVEIGLKNKEKMEGKEQGGREGRREGPEKS